MASYNLSPQITKLNANNFSTWRKDIRFILNEKNAWRLIEKTETPPSTKDIEDDPTLKSVLVDYENRFRFALTCIYMNIEPEYRSIIENVESPIEAWELLNSYFQPDSKARHMALFSDLLSCFISPNESVGLYSARLTKIAESLKDIGHPVPELYLSFQLLRFLPYKFDNIVQSILRWSDDRFKFKDIILELVAEETRLTLRESDRGRTGDMIEIQNTTFSPKFKNVTCFRCGKKGHFQRDCRVKEPRARSYSPSNFSRVTCYKCGRKGHVQRNCRARSPSTQSDSSSYESF